jgi:serine/threonine-protein kinase
VLRSLAKDPAERYRTAKDMDRDLELVARGETVGRETEDAATMVLAGQTSVTEVTPAQRRAAGGYGGDERYRAYDEPVSRGRGAWPWLLALGAVLALAVAGWFLYDRVQDEIASSKPVAVNDYQGIQESLAVANITEDGFEPRVTREPDDEVAEGYVVSQQPEPGTQLAKGSIVTIFVSTGKREVRVPSVVGKSEADAVAEITRTGLEARSVEVNSAQPSGTVTAQAPSPGTTLVAGSEVRINVSKGPKQVAVPSVVGLLYDTAASQLQAAEFAVARRDVDSDEPKGTVVTQDPAGNSTATKGSTVTLSVSKGPTTVEVPDVTGLDLGSARQTLRAAGFTVTVTVTDTEDESLDGLVASQSPLGGTQAEPKSSVSIEVWRYVAPPPATTETTETTTEPFVP